MITEIKIILLIDDVEENREILKRRLERDGFEVITAKNGKEGLDALQDHHVDLILLDINMPVMDGNTFLKMAKSDTRYSCIPVIILTAVDDMGVVIKSMRAGACGYLTKPFNMDQIRTQIDHCLGGDAPPEQPA